MPVRFVVYGSPNQGVKNALAAFNMAYMQPVNGFSSEAGSEEVLARQRSSAALPSDNPITTRARPRDPA